MVNLGQLNPQQREAAETIKGPVLILAGAGTGKTRVITFRISHMIDRGISPESILAVTFTNKAAREMQERVAKLIPSVRRVSNEDEKPKRPTICTFHSLCVRILREHIEKLGYKRNFVIYDESEQLGAVKKVLSRYSSGTVKVDPREVLGAISKFKNVTTNGNGHFGVHPDSVEMAERVINSYQSALKACNAVDFDDLILLALTLFEKHPETLEACRARYKYVMVDEYQDTNAQQFNLVHALTREHRNLCVVGDDDQSIYGWRGAEIKNLLELERYYPEVKVVKLEQNYRSTNTILSAANALIKRNARRRPKQLWSQKGEGERIALFAFDNEEVEAKTVVERIESNRLSQRIPWKDQAVLFRTNIQARPIETELRKAGVRYRLVGGTSFFDRREIRDFIAYLKMFINPHDDGSLLRIANVPPRGLSDGTMEKLLACSHERHCSVYSAMRHTDVLGSCPVRTQQSIRDFTTLVEKYRHELNAEHAPAQSRPIMKWSERFLAEIRYLDELRRTEKNPESAENRIRIVRDLIGTLDDVEVLPGASMPERIEAYLEQVALDQDKEDEREQELDGVTLITMHSCKGLEYPHVFVVGLEEGLLPHARSKVEGTLDEERRLFYVAITRAMRTLTLSHCGARKRYGKLSPCHPSCFIAELPEDLIEDGDEALNREVPVSRGKSLFATMRENLA